MPPLLREKRGQATLPDLFYFICVSPSVPLRLLVRILQKIKAPGMADMPGESQEEPSVMVVTILATIR